MVNENTHNCGCHGREEIELSDGVRPMAVLVDEDCDCECGEVELYTSKEPDVLLFEEYCEEYADDIVLAKEAAIAAKEAVETNAATIIAKENLLLDDHQTIKRELRQGIIDIRADIAAALAELKTKIQNAISTITSAISVGVGTITSNITSAKQELSSKIDALQFPTFEECSEQEILDMFPDEED